MIHLSIFGFWQLGNLFHHLVRSSGTPVLLVRGRPTTIGGGRYRLLRLLGEGNKKEVYLGYDTQRKREVAVTLVKSHVLSPEEVDRLKAGAESISTIGDQVAAPQPLAAQPQAGRRPRRKACSATAAVVTPRAQPQQS